MSTFSKSDQRELKEKVQKLTPEDLKSLSRISLSNTAPANARVLAVYMMGESDHGLAALTEFLSAKINLQENSPAHSVNEAANGREKALRIMAIEHIIENSPNASEAKKRLSDLIPKISDPWLRDFTERRLSETR